MKYRLIEKTVEFSSAYSGVTEAFDVAGAGGDSFSLAAVIDVDTPSAKTFDSGKQATLVNQGVTYLANARGTAGNSITIALIDTGVPSQTLEVDLVGTAISVNLALDAGVAAELEEQDLTYTADDVGVAGNDITIAYVDDGTAGAETVDVTGTDIVVHMDATPVTGSTATQIKAAVDASVPASALVSVAITGTGATVQTAVSETPLADGADPAITTDATALVAALDLDAGVQALISNTGSGASPLTALTATPLATGANSEVNITDDEITIPSHGLTEGLKGQLTSTGTLPAGVTTATDYFVIVVDANTIQLAASLVLAQAGTAIDLTNEGSNGAVNTFTATSIAGGSIKLQQSNDGSNWADLGSATNITADAVVILEKDRPTTRYIRGSIALTAGHISADLQILVKGDKE